MPRHRPSKLLPTSALACCLGVLAAFLTAPWVGAAPAKQTQPATVEKPFFFDPGSMTRDPFVMPRSGAVPPRPNGPTRERTLSNQYQDVAAAKKLLKSMIATDKKATDDTIQAALEKAQIDHRSFQKLFSYRYPADEPYTHILEIARAATTQLRKLEARALLVEAGEKLERMKQLYASRQYEDLETTYQALQERFGKVEFDALGLGEKAGKIREEIASLVELARGPLTRIRIARVRNKAEEIDRLLAAEKPVQALPVCADLTKKIGELAAMKAIPQAELDRLLQKVETLKSRALALIRRKRLRTEFQALSININGVAYPGSALVNGDAVMVGTTLEIEGKRLTLTEVQERGAVFDYQGEKFLKRVLE